MTEGQSVYHCVIDLGQIKNKINILELKQKIIYLLSNKQIFVYSLFNTSLWKTLLSGCYLCMGYVSTVNVWEEVIRV